MIAVLGGGFGLYGHLAALTGLGHRVATLRRYSASIMDRPDLCTLAGSIDFLDSEEKLLRDASVIVLARRPADNLALARSAMADWRRTTAVIEKPIGPEPESALALHDELETGGIKYLTPYLLLHTEWGAQLIENAPAQVKVLWRFPRRNAGDSWKYARQSGGGALAYYFLHLLPIAALLGEGAGIDVFEEREAHGVTAIKLQVSGSSRSFEFLFEVGDVEPGFEVEWDRAPRWADVTPFGPMPERGQPDPRIPVLQRFYQKSVFSDGTHFRKLQGPALHLWKTLADRASAV